MFPSGGHSVKQIQYIQINQINISNLKKPTKKNKKIKKYTKQEKTNPAKHQNKKRPPIDINRSHVLAHEKSTRCVFYSKRNRSKQTVYYFHIIQWIKKQQEQRTIEVAEMYRYGLSNAGSRRGSQIKKIFHKPSYR